MAFVDYGHHQYLFFCKDDDRPIEELLAAMDSETTIPPPIRDEDKPFLMQVSDYVHLSGAFPKEDVLNFQTILNPIA